MERSIFEAVTARAAIDRTSAGWVTGAISYRSRSLDPASCVDPLETPRILVVGQGVVGAVRVLVFAACLASLSGCGFPRPADVVPGDAATDSGSNGPADSSACFGSFVRICLASAPTMPFTVSTASNVDTNSPLCASTVSGATNYCVIAATNITIAATLRATGTKPLVLIATDSIVTTGLIDVIGGAGSSPSLCAAGTGPADGGGYAGGSFVGLGGAGGFGSNGAAGGMPAASVTDVTELRGGCPGQNSDNVLGYGVGGGAVFLIAGNRIDIQGGINASGRGGHSGDGPVGGGFGGGAGGMIGFEAPIITCNSLLLAAGGGGGGGGGGPFEGVNGGTPNSITPATGGGGVNGGQGGSGSTPSRDAPGMAGAPGLAGNPPGNGGGGGGGAGLIKAPATANLGAMVSPPPTP